MKRLMYLIIGLLVILIILVFTGRKSVHHEINIDAKPASVWTVLSSLDQYQDWNPVMLPLEGKLEEGSQIVYQFTQDAENIIKISAQVQSISPQERLNQKGGLPLVISFDHEYLLSPQNGGTKVTIHEEYRGIYVNFWNPDPVEKAYQRLNEALKQRVESLNK
ncbi:MAG: SRPBCC domain-containing protein [Bacteroidota bacterium]